LTLPPGGQAYVYGFSDGGRQPTTTFQYGELYPFSINDAVGQIADGIALTTSNTNSYTTSDSAFSIVGAEVSGYSTITPFEGDSGNNPDARTASVSFSVSTANSLTVIVALASSQSNLVLSGASLTVAAESVVFPGGTDPVEIAYSYLSPGSYVVTETTAPTCTSGCEVGAATDLIGALVFNPAVGSPAPSQTRVPSGIVEYLPITLTNSQPSAAPAPFQQMIQVDSATYASSEASNLQNVEFFTSQGSIIPSWLESGASNTATNTVYWLRLSSGIAADSSLTIFMGFASTASNLLNDQTTGEAPQLSPTYAEYDDGGQVFPYYQTWGGLSSLPSGWVNSPAPCTGQTAVITFMPDYTIFSPNPACGYFFVYDTSIPQMNSPPLVAEFYGDKYDNAFAESAFSLVEPGSPPLSGGYGFSEGCTGTNPSLIYFSDGGDCQAPTSYTDRDSAKVYTIEADSYTTLSLQINYSVIYSTNNAHMVTIDGISFAPTNKNGNTPVPPISVYWLRARAPPPGGVMPTVSIGSATMTSPSSTITSPASAPSATPPGTVEYVPITLTNSQPSATPAPFQQMIQVDSATYSTLEASNLRNVEFFDSSGTVVPSWLENGSSSSSTDTIYWMSLSAGIPASASVTVYMGFVSTSTNLFNTAITGEAPNLSAAYGQYDDGARVFPFYDNFAGTTLSSAWSENQGSGSISVANGLTISGNNGYVCSSGSNPSIPQITSFASAAQFTGPSVFDISFKPSVGDGPNFRFGFTDSNLCPVQDGLSGHGVTDDFGSDTAGNPGTGEPYSTQFQIGATNGGSGSPPDCTVDSTCDTLTLTANTGYNVATIAATDSVALYYLNYQATSPGSVTTNIPSYSSSIGVGIEENYVNTPVNVDWVRTRAYPPNGVMPSFEIGGPMQSSQSSGSSSPAASFQYTLSTISSTVYINSGNSAAFGVQANLISGTPSPVSLSAAWIPTGTDQYFTTQFGPSSGTPSFTFFVTVQASSTTPTADYTLQILGSTSQSNVQSVNVQVDVSGVSSSASCTNEIWTKCGAFAIQTTSVSIPSAAESVVTSLCSLCGLDNPLADSSLNNYPIKLYSIAPACSDTQCQANFDTALGEIFQFSVSSGDQADSALLVQIPIIPILNTIVSDSPIPNAQSFEIPTSQDSTAYTLGDDSTIAGITPYVTLSTDGSINILVVFSSATTPQVLAVLSSNSGISSLVGIFQAVLGVIAGSFKGNVVDTVAQATTLVDRITDAVSSSSTDLGIGQTALSAIGDMQVNLITSSLNTVGALTSYNIFDFDQMVNDISGLLAQLASGTGVFSAVYQLTFHVLEAFVDLALLLVPEAVYHAVQSIFDGMNLVVALISYGCSNFQNYFPSSLCQNYIVQGVEDAIQYVTSITDPNQSTIIPSFYNETGSLVLGYNTTAGTMKYGSESGLLLAIMGPTKHFYLRTRVVLTTIQKFSIR